MLFLFVLTVISIGIRFVPHVPNFSPLIALAVISGMVSKDKRCFLLPLGAVIVSDIFMGISDVSLFVWLSIAAIAVVSRFVSRKPLAAAGFSLASAVAYFVVTNFGVWLMGWYEYSLWGLYTCFLRAVPFFRAQFVSTLIFTFVYYVAAQIVVWRSVAVERSEVLLKK